MACLDDVNILYGMINTINTSAKTALDSSGGGGSGQEINAEKNKHTSVSLLPEHKTRL
jgi:hypothetical protein